MVTKKHIFASNLIIIISIENFLKEKKKLIRNISIQKMKYKYKYPKEGNYVP